MSIWFKCNVQCNSCHRNIHKTVCSGLNDSETEVGKLKGKQSRYFYCEACTKRQQCKPELSKEVDNSKIEEDEFAEIQEQRKRSNNIVMYNIPESGDDKTTAEKLVAELVGRQRKMVSVTRVGKANQNGARALLVTFHHSQVVHDLLANRYKLKGRNIYIGADLTRKQREAERKLRQELENHFKDTDPFADASKGADDDVQDGLVHIRIQQRNGRKTLTTVQGLSSEYDLKKIVRACKKEFACNGTVIEHPEYGEVLQLQGDQRENICQWLTKAGLAKPDQLKVHGF